MDDARKVEGSTLDDNDTRPVWDRDYLPPPWSAVQDEVTSLWEVTCDGYDDEMPVVCAGTPTWPLDEADARILSAALDCLAAARVLASIPIGPEYGEDRDLIIYRNAGCMITLGDVRDAQAAVAKADLRTGGA